jgi:hypothetical protein
MTSFANIFMVIPILMFALYGFILWLFYRMVVSVEKISERMTEIADLLQRNLARPDQPPLPPAASQ